MVTLDLLRTIWAKINPISNFFLAFVLAFSGVNLPSTGPDYIPLAGGTLGLFIFLITLSLLDDSQSYEHELLSSRRNSESRIELNVIDSHFLVQFLKIFMVILGILFWLVFSFTAALTYWFALGILQLMSVNFFAGDWFADRPATHAFSRRIVFLWLAAFAVSVQDPDQLSRYSTWLLGFLCIAAHLTADFAVIGIYHMEETESRLSKEWLFEPIFQRIVFTLSATMYCAYRLAIAPWLVP